VQEFKKTFYSASVEPTPNAWKKVLHIKKDHKSFEANENNCGFYFINYYCEKSIKESDWIYCQVCKTWHHELCVGAFRKKTFTCGKCD
jgi:hypothetical protein